MRMCKRAFAKSPPSNHAVSQGILEEQGKIGYFFFLSGCIKMIQQYYLATEVETGHPQDDTLSLLFSIDNNHDTMFCSENHAL